MNLQECYAAMGGNYEEAMGRLRMERLVKKFILKFADDDSYGLLLRSMEEKNYSEAFRAAHTIKGVCQNLSLSALSASSSQLSEALRHGYTPEADGFFEAVKRDYRQVIEAIGKFREENGE